MGALLFPAGTDGSVVALSVGAGSLITTPVAERKAALEAVLDDPSAVVLRGAGQLRW